MEREDGDARRHGRHDEVFVEGVAAAEDGDVEEHDGEEFAAFGEEEGDVVDVGEGGVAEGRGEGACYGYEGEGPEDAQVGDRRGD